MRSLDSLLKLPRCVAITYKDITAPGEKYRPPLPKSGTKIIFSIKLGPVTEENETCELLLGLKASEESSVPSSTVTVTVNNTACKVLFDTTSPATGRLLTLKVPLAALKQGEVQMIKIKSKDGKPLTVQRVEMSLGLGDQ